MRKPKIGIIGAGIHGTKMLQAYSAAEKKGQIELVALADIKEKVVEKHTKGYDIKGYYDYKEMLDREELDGVAIATPDHLHREIALEAAERGLHMLVQKPLDVTVKGANEIVKAVADNEVLLYVDFHKRFDPGHISLKKDIDKGNLGNLQYGYVWMEDKLVVPSEWLKNWAHNSSPVWFLGIHFYDLIYWLTGSEPVKIYATGVKDKLAAEGIDTYDSVQSKIELNNGMNFTVDTSWILPDSFPSIVNQGIRIVGSEGIWEADSQDRGLRSALEKDESSTVSNPFSMEETYNPFYGDVPQGYVIESMLYFLDLVSLLKSGKKLKELEGYYPSGKEAVISTKIGEYTHKSLKKEKIIELDVD